MKAILPNQDEGIAVHRFDVAIAQHKAYIHLLKACLPQQMLTVNQYEIWP
jgi:hypothetical protein